MFRVNRVNRTEVVTKENEYTNEYQNEQQLGVVQYQVNNNQLVENEKPLVMKTMGQYQTLVYKNDFHDAMSLFIHNIHTNKLLFGIALLNSLMINFTMILRGHMFFSLISIVMTMLAFYAVCIAIAIPINILYLYIKKDTTLTDHILMFFDDYFTEQTTGNKDKHYWHTIKKIEQNSSHIFIYISHSKAHVIPKRIFANETAVTEFIDFMQHKINLAKLK